MVHNLQSSNGSMDQVAIFCIEFSDLEVSIAGAEGLTIRAWSEFDILVDHGLAQIDLPFIESDIAPAVYLDDMVLPTILASLYLFRISPLARAVYLAWRLHA